jgi:hypothetical protein
MDFKIRMNEAHQSLKMMSKPMGQILEEMESGKAQQFNTEADLALHWLIDVEMIRMGDKSLEHTSEDAITGHRMRIVANVLKYLFKLLK